MSTKILKGQGRDIDGCFTMECGRDTNRWLAERGVESYGNAYHIPAQFKSVINGYDHVELPSGKMEGFSPADSTKTIMQAHRAASDYIKDNFSTDQLDKNQNYVVNMYYNTSSHMNDFYKNAEEDKTDNYGTHVGRLYHDPEQGWLVEHNVNGNVHINPFNEVVGGFSNSNKYGVTSISTTKPTIRTWARNLLNKFR